MRCPRCRADDTKVIDSREADEGAAIRRRRVVPAVPAPVHDLRAARRGAAGRRQEPRRRASRSTGRKIVAGVSRGVKGRPGHGRADRALAEEVEDDVRLHGPRGHHRPSVGLAVLERLRCLDEVAYLRFASVYKGFDAAADFQRELVLLEKLQGS